LGFSVGGNVLLKYLGELGGGNGSVAPAAAATVSVPFDLSLGADWIERGFSRTYRSFLVRKLHRKVRLKADRLRSLIDVDRVLATRTFREFDDLATAPVHGFAGAEDYYRRSSSSRFVERIRTPTLVIQSLDDPFLPPSGIPREELESNDSIELRLYGRGGHVGFVAGSPWRPLFWAEETAAAFLAQRLLGASRPAPARE
jgi:predicted alpha/beta-fold hydrolase